MTTPYPHDDAASRHDEPGAGPAPADPSSPLPQAPPAAAPGQDAAEAGRTEHTVLLSRSQLAPNPQPAPQSHQPHQPHQGLNNGPAPATPGAPPAQQGQQPYGTVTGAPRQGPPPQGGYASPIPVTRTHLGHAIASEWTKIRSVRSTIWTLGIMFVLVVGVGFLTALGLSSGDSGYIDMPMLGGGLFGLMLGQLCIITLGVLVITSEYGTGMIRTTMTACPQRGRVLLAKALIFFGLAFVMTTVACTITAAINSAMLSGQRVGEEGYVSENVKDSIRDGELIATGGEWLGATVGAGLYVALLGLLSLAVGAMLRHSAGAITAMMGVVLLPLVLALFMQGESMRDVQKALLEYSPLNGLASLFHMPMEGDMNSTGWPLLGLLAAVTCAAVIGAYALLTKRDV